MFSRTAFCCCALFLAVLSSASGRILNRCQIAVELDRQGFSRSTIPDWVCTIEHESSGNTRAINRANSDGSIDYGLFQINDRYWCDQPAGRGCGIRCSDLLLDDITIAARCAKVIHSAMGFRAWVAWVNHCQGPLPDVSHCFGNSGYLGMGGHSEF